MDEEEIESFVKIKEKLEKKCKELEDEKERMKTVVDDDIQALEDIKQENLRLKNEFNEMYAKYNSIPKSVDKNEAKALKSKLEQLSNTYSQLQQEFIEQKQRNAMIAENLDKSFTQSSQNSVDFVKQSLLYELHELTQENAPTDKILKKEKQIQMCEMLY